MLSDFNCRIFDINGFDYLNEDADERVSIALENSKADIVSMTKLGFHRFFCHVRHNPETSPTYTKSKLNKLLRIAEKALPRDCGKISLDFVSKIYLSPDAPYIKNIDFLTAKKTNYIFVELPLDSSPDHVPETLNKLLYNCRLVPVFTEFQLYAMLYDPLEIEKMLRIKGAAFQFNIKTVFEPQNLKLIKKIIDKGNIVLIGSNCDHDMLNIREIGVSLDKFRKNIPDEIYREIVINARKFLK